MTSRTLNPHQQTQRRQRADGERTRSAILRGAASLATVDGLEGLSIGNLAAAIGISKSGLYAHFGSKQELQLATVDEAERILDRRGRSSPRSPPAPASPSWRRRARRSSATWSVASSPAAASSPPRRWRWAPAPGRSGTGSPLSSPISPALLRSFAATAMEQDELPAGEDPDRLAFELHAVLLGADTKFVLHDDPAVLDIARRVVSQRLGLNDRDTIGAS